VTSNESIAALVAWTLTVAMVSGCSRASKGSARREAAEPHPAPTAPAAHSAQISPVLELRLVVDADGIPFPERRGGTLLLAREVAVSTCDVEKAVAVRNKTATPGGEVAHVATKLSMWAGFRFERFTAEHVKQRVAIIVDGKIVSAPVMQAAIPSGHISVDADSMEEAVDLEKRLHERGECTGKL
jgi:hypothetical protein